MPLYISRIIKKADEEDPKKKRGLGSRIAPFAGAGLAASLPAASLAQYYNTDYPAYKHVLQTAPITTGGTPGDDNYSKSFDQFLGKLKPGDIMAQMTDPASTPIGTRGAATPTGGPFFHSGVVGSAGPSDKTFGGRFNNEAKLLEGGWAWPDPNVYLDKDLADKANNFDDQTVYSPHKFDHFFRLANNLHVYENAGVSHNDSISQRLTHIIKNRQAVGQGLARDWTKQMYQDPAAAKEVMQKLPSLPASEIKNDVLSDATTVLDEPALFLRPPGSGAPAFNSLLDKQLVSSIKQPYSDQEAITSSLKRVFLPSQGAHQINPTFSPSHNSADYCASPAGSFLNGLGVPSRGGASSTMPADAVSNPALSPVGIYVPQKANLGDNPRGKLLQWLETAKKYRTRSGLLAVAVAGLGGYGVTRGIQALMARQREQKEHKPTNTV